MHLIPNPHPTDSSIDERDSYMWRCLSLACGGLDVVDGLHDHPLPDEPFDQASTPRRHWARAHDVLLAVDAFCDRFLDVEYRTAMHRLLARAARRCPDWFAGRHEPDRLAAALAWVTMSGNFALSRRQHTWAAKTSGAASA